MCCYRYSHIIGVEFYRVFISFIFFILVCGFRSSSAVVSNNLETPKTINDNFYDTNLSTVQYLVNHFFDYMNFDGNSPLLINETRSIDNAKIDKITREKKDLSRTWPGRGRKRGKGKKSLMHMLMSLKILAAGFILPSVVALALFASWKGITLSLLAFMLATIVGVKSLFNKAHSDHKEKYIIIPSKPHSSLHEHWWRSDHGHIDDIDHSELAYKGHI